MEATLENILINSYNPNNQLRAQAEQALTQFFLNQGALLVLLNFIGNINSHKELRQAACVIIKNRLRSYWNDPLCTDEEKAHVKVRILEILLVETDNSIRGILAEAVRIISEFEFPERWPNLVTTLLENIQNQDVLKMYNSLLALRKVTKRYEYKQGDARKALDDIIQVSFPFLQQLMTNILNNNSLEAAQVMKMCLKIFFSATVYRLPQVQGVDVNLWFQIIAHIMNKHLPEASEGVEPLNQPSTKEERAQWPWWKLKKWAARIMTQFIQRYGNPRYCGEEFQNFAKYFRANTAAVLLGPAMNTLSLRAKNLFITDDVLRMCLTYVSNCVEMSPTYKLLKPHLGFLLFQVVFPTFCLSVDDIRLFTEDPVEFIRKVHDPMGDWLSPLVAATTLLQGLARYRQKDVLPVFLPFIEGILAEYDSLPADKKDYLKKDGALVSIAVLAKMMNDDDELRKQLPPFLAHHVVPEFQSSVPFLRARACWVVEYFHELDMGSARVAPNAEPGSLLQALLNGLLQGLRDPALPVQAAAACSLRLLISAEGATEILKPMLPQLVGEYFRIMDEVENESVLSALQMIVNEFGEEIKDISPMMVGKLVENFHQYVHQEDDEESAFNAVQCIDTIDSVLEAVSEFPEILKQIEPIVQPLLYKLLTEGDQLFEYIDTAVHILGSFTYFAEPNPNSPETSCFSPHLWSLCGPLIVALRDWAIDYISDIMNPILNYISKDTRTFIKSSYNGESLMLILLSVIQKAIENDESFRGQDSSAAATLLTCLITCSRDLKSMDALSGQTEGLILQPALPTILQLMIWKLQQHGKVSNQELEENGPPRMLPTSLRVKMLEVLMACIYYDTETTLSVLTSMPVTTTLSPDVTAADVLFPLLFEHLKDMSHDFTQRLIVLSFTELLSRPAGQLPRVLQGNVGAMYQQSIRELIMIEEEEGKEKKGDDDDDDDDDNENDEDDDDMDHEIDPDEDEDLAAINRAKALYVPPGGYDEEEDCITAEDETYREALESMDREAKVKRELYIAGEAVDDDDDDEYAFTSPIETMDVKGYFLQMMRVISERSPEFVAHLNSTLNAEDIERLNHLVNTPSGVIQNT